MSVPPNRPETAPAPASAPTHDDARKPRSLAERSWLFLLLIVLPAAVVCIPVVVQTHFFGQRPATKEAPHTEALQKTLEQSANNLLPAPPSLGPDPLVVTTRADRLAARMEKITKLAQTFGGSATEGLSTVTEKRLSVDLPAGRLEAFKQAVTTNTTPAALPSVAPSPSAGRDYIDIVIRAAGEDE